MVDIEQEKIRLEEEKKKVIAEITRAEKMLSNPGFTSKAPQAKIDAELAKQKEYEAQYKEVCEALAKF